MNSKLFDKELVQNKHQKHQVIFGKEWRCRTTQSRIKQQYKLKLGKFLKSIQAFSDHRTVGNLHSTQEKPPRTKALVSMPTRPLLGDSSFQAIFIQHLAAVSEKDWWVLRGDELWVAAKRCNCAKARREEVSAEGAGACRRGVSPHRPCNTLKKCVRRQHGCKLHSLTGDKER